MKTELNNANIMNYQGIDYIRLDQANEIFNQQTKELQEQLAEKTEALENSENGMLNLIRYKNEVVEQLAAKEKEIEFLNIEINGLQASKKRSNH